MYYLYNRVHLYSILLYLLNYLTVSNLIPLSNKGIHAIIHKYLNYKLMHPNIEY